MINDNTIYMSFILLQSIIYGLGNPLTKIAYESITPFWCLAFRFSLAFLIFIGFFGKNIWKNLKQLKPIIYLPAGICMAVAYIFGNLALQHTASTTVGFLTSLPIIIAPILSVIILYKKYNPSYLPFQAVVVIGLYLLCCNNGRFNFGLGEFFALMAAVASAAAMVFTEKSLGKINAVTITAVQILLTALFSLLGAICFEADASFEVIQPAAWAVVIYLAITSTCIAYMLQNTALGHLSASSVSLLQTTQPIMTAVFSFILLGEILSLTGLIGSAIILFCLIATKAVDHKIF